MTGARWECENAHSSQHSPTLADVIASPSSCYTTWTQIESGLMRVAGVESLGPTPNQSMGDLFSSFTLCCAQRAKRDRQGPLSGKADMQGVQTTRTRPSLSGRLSDGRVVAHRSMAFCTLIWFNPGQEKLWSDAGLHRCMRPSGRTLTGSRSRLGEAYFPQPTNYYGHSPTYPRFVPPNKPPSERMRQPDRKEGSPRSHDNTG